MALNAPLALHAFSWYWLKPPSQKPASPSLGSNQYQWKNTPTPDSKMLPCFEVKWPCFGKDSWSTWTEGKVTTIFLQPRCCCCSSSGAHSYEGLQVGHSVFLTSALCFSPNPSLLKGFSSWHQRVKESQVSERSEVKLSPALQGEEDHRMPQAPPIRAERAMAFP